ncbi:hypothetical protein [Encephalitozoon cuniculi GB-M1]|uniref:Uncharacterized protein n=1 Tax=Encephalitozoon cuniculi (strain GB-M1) TaxID=284813 RepID=Q8ST63_ENCCU|nr:uncharacterized protein ECU07_1810 [Encephalitozoon cuniculi GB-M1]NP_586124.1 uncharacterized protein ECU10_0080 [Encephalitozoon cuniculi GB-M1]CAD25712.1 hypothetical protein [Encephalitozoon cuniculi GB-M1]CAD25728.1 hypothetical protein [Encephalitozoon cuniculi GB-M1]
MGRLWQAARGCGEVFGRNLRAELEASGRLRDACASVAREYTRCVSFVRGTRVFGAGSRVLEASVRGMRLSDASIEAVLGMARGPGLWPAGALGKQGGMQRRLDTMFGIPQYYGGVRGGESRGAPAADGGCRTQRVDGGLAVYRTGVGQRMRSLWSWIWSLGGLGHNDSVIREIEDCLVPGIFGSIGSGGGARHLCSESGEADVCNLGKEMERSCGPGAEVVDIRRIETSGSAREKRFESRFEVEAAGRSGRHVFLAQGRFEPGGGRGGWRLSGLTWARVA